MSKPLNIVIADNESIIRMDLREMLEEQGHTIVGEAHDGKQALELTRKYRPDLVMMDIKMPNMDGITAAKTIADEGISPVILLTAFSDSEIVSRAKDAGVLAYLVKPIREESISPAIEIALSRWQEMKELEQELEEILASPWARRLRREFDGGRAAEPLCRRCGFAAERFGHGRKQASSKIQERE